MKDIFYMKKAIKLAKKGSLTTSPNPNVGCIIVNNNIIVGSGWHKKTGMKHAEIYALKTSGEKAKGATAYITLEPCSHFGKTPPCCVALTKYGISRVVIATLDPNPKVSGNGVKWLKKHGILVTIGTLSKESIKINKGFFQRMTTGIPWIKLKLASSIDGRTALNNGKSKWITSDKARHDVQHVREKSDAIISSSETILFDNPLLTVRNTNNNDNNQKLLKHSKTFLKQPIRVIIDSKNRITPSHKCIKQPGLLFLIRIHSDNNIWPSHIKQIILNNKSKKIDLIDLVKMLAKYQINNILIEAGPSLSSSFLKLNIINELIIYIAPKILGNYAKPLFFLENYSNLSDVPQFKFEKITQIGKDLKLILTKHNSS
ncbi:diaminohydroxyphosphoribosylaminopyrimidine deaminase [Buchnera aphidicola str. Bp (Baizongia pistaciae)]|uniref:Riboflavin biosynthesis protein RibD n=1 Tax=Buchnera aphidicola subsp. Baizongia pistaciae (strain Bp) TaxID=224915 RepID=RIBD_BUCBP|nr:bifunctional diaminohydroxyphosphoribosylaminopyrimidine deaminase/5-amino-6-(5-phosphoribosylamino)uracil reductase RibD [Buchnera aphidicola]Q89AB0.1 RecName: Full=Riboflavin biosynthesis protein RibD; Includes: RecName: Full=Diaminohydroxyphosphoribosylaminopyrimidine deaminase; Short=DRAP deaminase; AltName: Full=Riboflavin-specific deaminase; Includes: RecName: Full=5-amino-6-(5-phosphoribosylamino)uracil reductase; AltName: Full=HTP reductase [Buchnera aphidicola str. Bp (Baizongia pistac